LQVFDAGSDGVDFEHDSILVRQWFGKPRIIPASPAGIQRNLLKQT